MYIPLILSLSRAALMALSIWSSPCSCNISLPSNFAKGFSAVRSLTRPFSDKRNTLPSAMTGFCSPAAATESSITKLITMANAPMMTMASIVASMYLKKSFISYYFILYVKKQSSPPFKGRAPLPQDNGRSRKSHCEWQHSANVRRVVWRPGNSRCANRRSSHAP